MIRRAEPEVTTQTLAIDEFSVPAFPPGSRHRLLLRVFEELDGPVSLPVLVARGDRDGPTLLAVAGVHGDEYEGMEAIRQIWSGLDPCSLRGAFVGVPVANPFAYAARTRVAPLHLDGLNLARVFPGAEDGSPSRRLAHHLLRFVLTNLTADDLFLDFHSGSADVPYASLIGFRDVPGPARDRAEEAARHFGLPRLWRIPDAQGPFNAETARRGIPTLGTETTGRACCDPADVATYANGLRNLLAFCGMLPDAPLPPRHDGPARQTVDLPSPATGFMRSVCRLDQEVAAGDVLASIVTPIGDPLTEVIAPIAGTIWAARSLPAVRVGEMAYMIAAPA